MTDVFLKIFDIFLIFLNISSIAHREKGGFILKYNCISFVAVLP